MAKTERSTGRMLKTLPMDGAEEHKGQIKSVLEQDQGVSIKYSPAYAEERNGRAERLVRELTLRARVLLVGTILPLNL